MQHNPNLSGEDVVIDQDLPPAARARIEAARSRCEIEFRQAAFALGPRSFEEIHKEVEDLIVMYVHEVFYTFAEEAVNAGWTAEVVRLKASRFLIRLIDRAYFLKHPMSRTQHSEQCRAAFQDWALFAVQAAPAWIDFQQALLELATLDASRSTQPEGTTSSTGSPEPGQSEAGQLSQQHLAEQRGAALKGYMDQHSIAARSEVYRAAGVHKGEFYDWLSGKLPDSSKHSKKMRALFNAGQPG